MITNEPCLIVWQSVHSPLKLRLFFTIFGEMPYLMGLEAMFCICHVIEITILTQAAKKFKCIVLALWPT